ncbi:hypothetical protein [Halomicronema sp. CCY15110]|nr:hypothetical protein [Halomicronema sp. CCY15110]
METEVVAGAINTDVNFFLIHDEVLDKQADSDRAYIFTPNIDEMPQSC